MKTMQNFAAQQLSKKQMNDVKGGMGIVECLGMSNNLECTIKDSNGITRRLYGCGNTGNDAMSAILKEAGQLNAKVDSTACIWF